MGRNLNGDVVKVVLVEVCISEVDCLQLGKPFSFSDLPLPADVGIVPQQGQVHEAGTVVTQSPDLNSLDLSEVDTNQTSAVPAAAKTSFVHCTHVLSPGEDGGENIGEEAGAGEVGGVLAQVELAEMIHIQERETGVRGDELRQHDVDVLHLGAQRHSHGQALVTTTGFVNRLYCTSVLCSPATLAGVQGSEPES